MTAPIPSAPTTDLTLTQQTSQYNQAPYEDVLDAQAKVAPKAAAAKLNSEAALRNPAFTRT